MGKINRRDFFKTGAIATAAGATLGLSCTQTEKGKTADTFYSETHPMQEGNYSRDFNQSYRGPFLNRLAFPLGGIGAGMICIEGSGCIYQMYR